MFFNKETFDNAISLGFNCQTAFALTAFYYGNKTLSSNFFNWVYCSSVDSIVKTIETPEVLFSEGLSFNENSYMFNDPLVNFSYHSKIPRNVDLDEDIIKNGELETISRMSYLLNKTLEMINSDSKNLFILTYPSYWDVNEVANNMAVLSSLIKDKSKNKESKILFIFEKEYISNIKLPKYDNVIIKKTRYHADVSTAHIIDFLSWYFILNNFKFNNMPPLSLKNVYKYKKHRNISIKYPRLVKILKKINYLD